MPDKKDKVRIGNMYPGQAWIELHGSFTYQELRLLAQNVEKEYMKARNGNKN
jgi:hypothetical protein